MTKLSGMGKMTIFDGASAKSINPWDLDSSAGWTSLSGDELKTDEATYFRSVPWLYRAVKDRANNVSHMPYAVMLNGEEYDAEEDPRNDMPWWESITTIWHKAEMSLCLMGRAYVKLDVNPAGYIKDMRYLVPTAITEHYDQMGVVDYYEHRVKGQTYRIPPDQIVSMYDPDWTVENGPGNSSAAKAALTSAGVLYHTDQFISSYFRRGAVKVTIFTTIGFDQETAERLQRWWDKLVSGMRNAWKGLVLRGEAVKPVVIGEGLESLQDVNLTNERRQNIATALGVPESRMWSSASNYATRVQDDRAYFEGTIIPENELIEEGFNEQLFTAEHNLDGYSLQFKPETLDVFQAGALDQAQAVKAFTDAGFPLLMACDLAGVELDAEQRAELEAQEAQPEPVPPQLVDVAAGAQPQLPAPQEQAPSQDYQNALAMWQRKAIKRWRESGNAHCEFTSEFVVDPLNALIEQGLMDCKTIDDIKSVFIQAASGVKSGMVSDNTDMVATITLIETTDQIKRAVDWLEAHA